jgi:hypothetical protein
MTSTITLLLLIGCVTAAADSGPDNAAWKRLHQQAVNRQRRIIFNNDGNEPVYYCKEATAAELLRSRTSALNDFARICHCFQAA